MDVFKKSSGAFGGYHVQGDLRDILRCFRGISKRFYGDCMCFRGFENISGALGEFHKILSSFRG